jgi:hypothetical protein
MQKDVAPLPLTKCHCGSVGSQRSAFPAVARFDRSPDPIVKYLLKLPAVLRVCAETPGRVAACPLSPLGRGQSRSEKMKRDQFDRRCITELLDFLAGYADPFEMQIDPPGAVGRVHYPGGVAAMPDRKRQKTKKIMM